MLSVGRLVMTSRGVDDFIARLKSWKSFIEHFMNTTDNLSIFPLVENILVFLLPRLNAAWPQDKKLFFTLHCLVLKSPLQSGILL